MEPTREEALTREILAMYEEYVRAFLSDDMDTINRPSLFPIAFIADDRVVTMDEYPVKRRTSRQDRVGGHLRHVCRDGRAGPKRRPTS
jgi:hypothetical protein